MGKKVEKKKRKRGKGQVYPINTERNQLGWAKRVPVLRTKRNFYVQNNVRWTNLTDP